MMACVRAESRHRTHVAALSTPSSGPDALAVTVSSTVGPRELGDGGRSVFSVAAVSLLVGAARAGVLGGVG